MLTLRFASRSQVWSAVQSERLFVPSAAAPTVGEPVVVQVEAPDLESPLRLTGQVAQAQAGGGAAPAGVWVKLDADSLQRARLASGDENGHFGSRAEPRAECDLEATVLGPPRLDGARVRTLSRAGLTLKVPRPVAVDTTLKLEVALPDGPAALEGVVAWYRAELQQCGLQLAAPAPALAARLDALVEQLRVRSIPTPAPFGDPSRTPRTVLVADDDPDILAFSSLVIRKSGYRAISAARGDEALELARRERPALLLLDVLMPGLDGTEVCREVRADPLLKDTPVVLLSAMGEDRLEEAAARVGASAWLTKPMRLDALRDLFKRLLAP